MENVPLRTRLIILGVLAVITALLYAVPTWLFATAWPVHGSWAWLLGAVLAVVQLVSTLLANGRRHLDAAGVVAHSLLGLAWIAFSWTVLTSPLLLVLSARTIAVVVVIVGALLAVYGVWSALRTPGVRRSDVVITGLPETFDGLRLAMVSDTHFDAFTSPATGRRLAGLLNSLEADVVVHCGDLADGSVAQRRAHVAPLAEVEAPTRMYIAGNHEYYSDATSWRQVMDELGWTVLTNSHRVLRRGEDALVIAGLDDPTGTTYPTGGPDVDAALAGAPDAPVVLLAHQPHQVREVRDRCDLVLSGHTHGGQIWPFHLLVLTREPVLHGLSRHGERTQLWVSRGAGFWGPPFRVFAPSDVSLLTLRS